MSDDAVGHATEPNVQNKLNQRICVVARRKIFLNVPLSTPQNIFLGRLASTLIYFILTADLNQLVLI